MPRYAPETVSTVTLGMIVLGLLLAWIGFSPAERFPDYRARLAARAAAVTGLALTASGLAARLVRRPWASWASVIALGALFAVSAAVLVAFLIGGRYDEGILLPGLGVVGSFRGILFWLRPEIREQFGQDPRHD